MVLPALVALTAGNFQGSDRAIAYGVLGGVAGAGIAVGPILGGWVTTDFTWRLVFLGEVVVAANPPRHAVDRRTHREAACPSSTGSAAFFRPRAWRWW